MQVWERTVEGRHHRVEAEGSVRRRLRWYVDGELVAEKQTVEDGPELDSGDDHPDLGAVKLKFSTLGSPRRATLHGDVAAAIIGVGGTDLVPAEGSPAALHEARMLAHPNRYAARQAGIAVAIIAVPVLLGLLSRFLPDIDIPWPDIDLPSIPWPDIDLPSIPWPDIDLPIPHVDLEVPAWVRRVADVLGYVWPVALAFVLARGEVNRRRKRDQQAREEQERADQERAQQAEQEQAGRERAQQAEREQAQQEQAEPRD
ncbi:hypothetical protein [Nocardioides marmotae]|uniref:hypothetical protein n=1 Tax=Nocardioides marmotae TaxID=2663857 RepID=UPI0012B608B6|nr:hypothetical protein [Nocardioides marmotae]MBC9732630.1 hypothetical protein [Nocardioides marmotae]MTB83747.1 hypothetical protein [Nocardioides marmotae]